MSDRARADDAPGVSASRPGLVELGCMGLIAEIVLWTVALIAIGVSGSELWGYLIGVVAGVLALGLMFRRWSGQPQRNEGGRRRGGETFESDAADSDGGGD